MAETSYQMLDDLSFWDWEINKTSANFSGKKNSVNEAFRDT